MQYMLLIHSSETAVQSAPQEATARMHAAYMAYTDAIAQAGVVVNSNRLRPTSATTTVRVVDGKTQVLDGPYAETKEQLLGFYLVDCKNLDEALDVARELGAANPGGAYEIRPVGM